MAAPGSSSSPSAPSGHLPNDAPLPSRHTFAGIATALATLVAGATAFMLGRPRPTGASSADGASPSLATLDEARMMAIIRASSDAIITIDDAQRIVLFNPAAEAIFRCPVNDAIGSPIDRFIPDRFRKTHKQHVERFGVTGVSERRMGRQLVLSGLRANGTEFPIEASISQIDDAKGKLYTVVLRDVTARVDAENALTASREELRKLSANLQRVREEDRKRVARELHDDLGQQLTALKMDLSSVQEALENGKEVPPSVLTQLQAMRGLVDMTIASMRRIAADLRPVMLDDLGLLPAIEWLTDDFTSRYGIAVERRIESGDMAFSYNGATTLFRIAQEALTNVARHAEATRVALTLVVKEDQCILRISDNGRGATSPMASAKRAGESFGLIGVRERANMLGGSVSIETAVQHGFTITVTIPLAGIQRDEDLP